MLKYLRDPIWQFLGVVATVVLGLGAIALANPTLIERWWQPVLMGTSVLIALVAVLLATVPLARKWLEQRKRRIEMQRLHYDHWQKVETLTELIGAFATLEKAKCLADTMKGSARVVAILPVDGAVGLMLNIGTEEDVQVGTELLVHRIDRYTSDGHHIEQPLALVRVTYVQAENNCSQALVVGRLDPEFWDQATARLRREKRIEPPRNFAVPYVPAEMRSLSLESLAIFRESLETIRDSLTRTGLSQTAQEENLQ